MSGQEDKNINAKSKIEQIKEELEKKLAAIEKAKTAPQSKVVDLDKEAIAKKLEEKKKEVEIIEEKNDLVFEISDKIENIEDVKEDKSSKIEDLKKEFESKIVVNTESSKIKNIVEVPVKGKKQSSKVEKLKEIIKSEASVSDKTTENTIIPPPKTVVADIHVNQQKPIVTKERIVEKKEENVVTYVEEKPKKKSNFFLYALLLLLFGGIAYLLVNYLNQNKAQQKIIMDQKLSEFKNKRYLDSIELADLNGQLLDLQSKKMIDSLDQIYEQELLAKSKFKNKIDIKRKFSVNGNEIVNNSKGNNVKSKEGINANTSSDGNVIETNSNENKDIVSNEELDSNKDLNVTSKENDDNTNLDNSQTDGEENSIIKNETSDVVNSKKDNNKEKAVAQLKEESKEVAENQPEVLEVPIYPGCEKKKTELYKKKCLTSKMHKNILRHFNSGLAQNIGLESGMHVVRINFIIDKHGYATVLNVRGENKILEDEAVRVIQALPKMKPGTVNGKKSNIPYNIPIRFIVEN